MSKFIEKRGHGALVLGESRIVGDIIETVHGMISVIPDGSDRTIMRAGDDSWTVVFDKKAYTLGDLPPLKDLLVIELPHGFQPLVYSTRTGDWAFSYARHVVNSTAWVLEKINEQGGFTVLFEGVDDDDD